MRIYAFFSLQCKDNQAKNEKAKVLDGVLFDLAYLRAKYFAAC